MNRIRQNAGIRVGVSSLGLLIALGGCYAPELDDCRITCQSRGVCPSGLSCVSGWCRSANAAGECAPDAATLDAATIDAAMPDAAVPDTATADAATIDAATPDAATNDAATPDAATTDAGLEPWARIAGSEALTAGLNQHPATLRLGAAVALDDRIVVAVAASTFGPAVPSVVAVTDDLGHTYARDVSQGWFALDCKASCNGRLEVWSANVRRAGTPEISVEWIGSGGHTIVAVAYSGLSTAASAVDVATSTAGMSQMPTSGATGAIASDGELVIAAFAADGRRVTFTPTDGSIVVTSTASGYADLALTERESGPSGTSEVAAGSTNIALYWAKIIVVYARAP